MFQTKKMRRAAVAVGCVTLAVSAFVVPIVAACVVAVLAFWGSTDAWINVVKPWIDAGDDDDDEAMLRP